MSMPRSCGVLITPNSRRRLVSFGSAFMPTSVKPAIPRIACSTLFHVAALRQICDTFFSNNMGQVIAINHYRFNCQISVLSQFESIQLFYEARSQFFTEGFCQLYNKAFAAMYRTPQFFIECIFLTTFQPCTGGMTTTFGSQPILGAPPKPATRFAVAVEELP